VEYLLLVYEHVPYFRHLKVMFYITRTQAVVIKISLLQISFY